MPATAKHNSVCMLGMRGQRRTSKSLSLRLAKAASDLQGVASSTCGCMRRQSGYEGQRVMQQPPKAARRPWQTCYRNTYATISATSATPGDSAT